jgi:hypothetical protein
VLKVPVSGIDADMKCWIFILYKTYGKDSIQELEQVYTALQNDHPKWFDSRRRLHHVNKWRSGIELRAYFPHPMLYILNIN